MTTEKTRLVMIEGFYYPQAIVRPDLIEQELSVPVGEEHYGSPEPLPYRWKDMDTDDEQFQIYLNGKWQDAESIDWDFID
jgi:hypothetical protein